MEGREPRGFAFGYCYGGYVQVGRYSAVAIDASDIGFELPSGQNVPCLGIIQEAIVPAFATDQIKGSYEGISGLPWPPNTVPIQPFGLHRAVVVTGASLARAAGAINRGDRLIADNLGRVASVNTLAIPAGTLINVLGIADWPAVNIGDLLRVIVNVGRQTV